MFCSILELNYKGGQNPMKKLETITTTEYKVTEVVCNGCGKPIPCLLYTSDAADE